MISFRGEGATTRGGTTNTAHRTRLNSTREAAASAPRKVVGPGHATLSTTVAAAETSDLSCAHLRTSPAQAESTRAQPHTFPPGVAHTLDRAVSSPAEERLT